MDKEKLRKADLLTSILVTGFGLWICSEAMSMPMKDSYGGVQNVWYVSPALFPLFVGIAISLLGMVLFKVALTTVGVGNVVEAIKDVFRGDEGTGVVSETNFRFLAIVLLFVCYVYLYIPRVDFLISSLLFLFVFINMFHLEDHGIMKRMLGIFAVGAAVTIGFFALGLDESLGGDNVYPGDWLTLVFLALMIALTCKMVAPDPDKRKRFRNGTLVAFIAPFVLGPIFKFFLLVPLPYEGIIVTFLDMLWYWEF